MGRSCGMSELLTAREALPEGRIAALKGRKLHHKNIFPDVSLRLSAGG